MKYRTLGKTGIKVSEIGFGAWGIGGGMWGAAHDDQSLHALEHGIELGLNFIDTAFDYGDGHSETLVGQAVRRSGKKYGEELFVATKIPPKNRTWPAKKGSRLNEVFPNEYILEYTEKSLQNLGLPHIDLLQFHVWQDDWAERDEWKEAITEIRRQGMVRHWGISINDYQPANAIKTLETGLIGSVQVIYNIFEQTPEQELFPACQELNVGVIARVPLDEGGLTGAITPATVFAEDDWRSQYFRGDRKEQLQERLQKLETLFGAETWQTRVENVAEGALRFTLSHPAVSTVIPGMRSGARVETNCAVSDGRVFTASEREALKAFNWPRNWYE